MDAKLILRAVAVALAAGTAGAQQAEDGLGTSSDVETVRIVPAGGASLRGLDKVSGNVVDFELALDESFSIGSVEIFLRECRYPEDNLSGEAYAWLDISDVDRERELFSGWMVASSPALNALDHPRYDVWVLRCVSA